MPKSVVYQANSIIYFQGDKAEFIPLLKTGRVEIVYRDSQTDQEQREPISTSEFFGVKATLGHHPHEETAIAISNCTVLHFSTQEFEALVSNNPRILMKMLHVFSMQLRRIHSQVQSLISDERINTSSEAGLFAIGEYYLKENQHSLASQVFKRYLQHYPKGLYALQATLKAGEADSAMAESMNESGANTAFSVMKFDEIHSFYKEGHYKAALVALQLMIEEKRHEEHRADAEFLIGCCLYQMKEYTEAARKLSEFIRNYPNHVLVGEALWYMGLIHDAMGRKDKSVSFCRKASKVIPKNNPLYRKVQDHLRTLGVKS